MSPSLAMSAAYDRSLVGINWFSGGRARACRRRQRLADEEGEGVEELRLAHAH